MIFIKKNDWLETFFNIAYLVKHLRLIIGKIMKKIRCGVQLVGVSNNVKKTSKNSKRITENQIFTIQNLTF